MLAGKGEKSGTWLLKMTQAKLLTIQQYRSVNEEQLTVEKVQGNWWTNKITGQKLCNWSFQTLKTRVHAYLIFIDTRTVIW